jgi:hypothetical protein
MYKRRERDEAGQQAMNRIYGIVFFVIVIMVTLAKLG